MGLKIQKNISEEEQRKADAWFESFMTNTKNLGISFDNPLSLGLIKAVNDYDLDEFARLRDSDVMDDNVKETHERVIKLLHNMNIKFDEVKAQEIMNNNLVQSDFFLWDFENWCPIKEPKCEALF